MDDDLVALENEIRSLQAEIEPLQSEYQSLLRQVAHYEAQNKIISVHSKPAVSKEIPLDDHEDAPPVIHDEIFDESIRKYFKEQPHESVPPVVAKPTQAILADIEQRTIGRGMLLVENVRRFGGVTAFPLNDHLYDSEDCTLLGLRFDLLSHACRKYREPYYIILRKKRCLDDTENAQLPWLIFRYTTPAYVSLDELSSVLAQDDNEDSLVYFAEAVRRRLVLVQHKHESFERLAEITYDCVFDNGDKRVIASVEKDPEGDCSLVLVDLKNHKIELICNETNVIDVKCASLKNHETKIRNTIVLRDLNEILLSFKEVYLYLYSSNII